MRGFQSFSALSLRSKVLVTLAGTATVVVAFATYLSLSYWEDEAIRASEEQGLVAARAIRNSLETAIRSGRDGGIRRALLDVMADSAARNVRVYDRDGTILYSSDPAEEGVSSTTFWVPEDGIHAAEGFVHIDDETEVHAVMPMSVPPARTLEVVYSAAEIREGTRRGALLGVGLAIGSIFAIATILGAMLEREVVTPIHRMEREITERTGRESLDGDEVDGLRQSLDELIEQERTAASRAREQAEMAELGEMAAEMAHEFKRPLAAIRAALDMLDQEYHLDSGGRAVMGSVNEQLEHLTGTMQDLFSLAQPQDIQASPVEFHDVVEDALMEFAGQPGSDRIEVVRDYRADSTVLGEARRLRQAVANLMMNALEAMPDGGRMTLRLRRDDERAVLEVSDTGPGIPEELRETIFLPFHTTKTAGTGLGLPLVARVATSHGGTIDVDSTAGLGSTFTIRLPLHQPAPVPSAV